MKIKLTEIQFRKDLYPRIEFKQELVERYSNAIEFLPPVKINQNNILIDGWHRWKAHQLAEVETIKVEIVKTESEQKLIILAYKLNSMHGMQLSIEEKKKFAREMYGIMSEQEIANTISVGKSSIYNWTTTQRENAKAELERKAIKLYLRAWNTQESIAKELDEKQQTISNILTKYSTDGKFCKDWNLKEGDTGYSKEKPFRYNIWNLKEADKETSHFGYFPQIFMENLIYYHTEPLDIIYDPFAGDGTTIDACKKWYRRYYCSDLKVVPGREEDIKQWKIQDGLPKDLPKPALLFLDPPYWLQSKNEYSTDKNDLANMSLKDFYSTIEDFLRKIIAKKPDRIAIVISPTQYPNKNHEFEDHIFKFNEVLVRHKYEIEMRCCLPYPTELYDAAWVEMMKKEKKCISIIIDLVIWKRL